MTNYIYYNYAKSAVCKVSEEQNEYIPATSIDRYLNQICIRNGSTLQGRRQAFAQTMKLKQFIPIILQEKPHIIFFPIRPLKDPDNLWICYEEIERIQYNKKTCTIFFKDHTCLECTHPQRIQRQMRQIFRYLRRFPTYS